MRLFFIRHAEAIPLEIAGVNADADRPLTEVGQAQCRALATALQGHGVRLDVILTSPYLRARQTTQGLLDHWSGSLPRVEECQDLAPEGKCGKLARTLRKLKADHVALVGHMPDLALHTAWFMGSKKARLDFDKAGAALLECGDSPDKGACCLMWLVTPAWFRSRSE